MRRILVLLLALTLIASSATAEYMLVHITGVCYDVNHVGSKWYGYYSISGTEVADGSLIDLMPGTYEFYTEVYDNDAQPDTGSYSSKIKVSQSRLEKGFSVDQTVTVTENAGNYRDYWNEWYITYELVPVDGADYVLNTAGY